eukprot:4681288-Prymnesium_polylepis.1
MKWLLAVGAHPFLGAFFFRDGPLVERARWYLVAYGYLIAAVALIVCAPLPSRRVLGTRTRQDSEHTPAPLRGCAVPHALSTPPSPHGPTTPPHVSVAGACLLMLAVMAEHALAEPCAQLPWLLPLYYYKYLCCCAPRATTPPTRPHRLPPCDPTAQPLARIHPVALD